MVIFRIFFNLFRMVSRLGFNLLWLPVFILTRHLFLTLILVAIFVLYLFFSSDDQVTRSRGNTNPATMVETAEGRKIQVATPVRRVENGDSAFTNDIYSQMTREEQQQYSQVFFQIMATLADGQTHGWSGLDIGGRITVNHSFTNNNGARCRMFSEVLKVHAVQQNISGMACEAGGGRWCKLRSNATPACGLGNKPGILDSISGSWRRLF